MNNQNFIQCLLFIHFKFRDENWNVERSVLEKYIPEIGVTEPEQSQTKGIKMIIQNLS